MKESTLGTLCDKRMLVLAGLGFLLGRVWLFSINPFAIAFFATICTRKTGRKLIAVAVLAGMMTSADGIALLKYMILFVIVLCINGIQVQMKRGQMSGLVLALLCGGLNLLLGMVNSFLAMNSWEVFWLSVLESIAVFALSNVLQWGVRFILYEEWKKELGNEELISLLLLIVTAMYGIPRVAEDVFSVVGTISCLLILVMGYRYGAAFGAISGAACGLLAVTTGSSMVLVGLYCLLGVSTGTFRRLGRIGSSIAFVLMGILMAYAAKNEISGIIELRAILSSVVIFLAIPKSLLHMVEKDANVSPDTLFAREDVRALANYRMEDFSDAFRRLSKSFMKGEQKKKELSETEMEKIFEELSGTMCRDCVNCKFCWDRHYEETNRNLHQMLWNAGQNGAVALEEVEPDFGRRCIRLDSFREKIEEKVALAKVNLGWHNRLAENREVMARQMYEVAEALQSFTFDLEETSEMPAALKKKIIDALKKEGVKVKKISVKHRKERLEVVFTGNCIHHQCLTKSDLSRVLSEAAGVELCPGRETRNVLSIEETTMFFHEDTRFKALTGLARVAKSGESVSGDNYSFLELQNGELLMVLADGMGSGELAYRDSGNLIEALEHLMEAGLEKKSALRLLNTLFVMNYEGESFTTLDLVSVDLHTGRCEIIKNGAAATFIKRENGVQVIQSEALPVGVDMEAESDTTEVWLEEGDMIIMVSDGVVDGYYGGLLPRDEESETLEQMIGKLTCQNPNDMANQILMQALARSLREATDDMSVLVAGIWNKN